MTLTTLEHTLDLLRNDTTKIAYLEKAIPQLLRAEQRGATLILANLYSLTHQFTKAAALYKKIGMNKEAVKARMRL